MILAINPGHLVILSTLIIQTNPNSDGSNGILAYGTIALVITTGLLVLVTYYYARQTRHTVREMKSY
jgi:hypothetical protein